MDDTLYPEREYVKSGFAVIADMLFDAYGLDPEDCYNDLLNTVNRGISGNNFNVFLDENEISYNKETITDLIKAYRNHAPDIELPKETSETLISLRQRGLKLGLLTDGYLDAQKQKVRSLNLEKYFDAIVYSDAYGRVHWKPSIKPFREIMELLHVNGTSCIYVADNPEKDFKGAKECGMLGIQTIQWVERDILLVPKSYKPDFIIQDISEIQFLLGVK